MISFDDINFQHESTTDGKLRLIIVINECGDLDDDKKDEIRQFLEALINE